jgi:predicted TIM-barrel fold metal-dependent hydrolase
MSKEELIDSHQHLWVMSEREYSWIEPSYGPYLMTSLLKDWRQRFLRQG